jgi:cell division protease FtsH
VSIISRGQALGYTITLPTEDKFMVKRGEIMDKLAHMLGGRVAEEIRFDDITTGASNDLQRATETTRRMITQYGMSENLGPLTFGHDPAQPFVGRDYGMGQEYSEETAQKIDAEIRRVIDEAYAKASRILAEHRDELDKISLLLISRETIDRDEFEALLAGEDPDVAFKEKDEKRAKKTEERDRRERQKKARDVARERLATGTAPVGGSPAGGASTASVATPPGEGVPTTVGDAASTPVGEE